MHEIINRSLFAGDKLCQQRIRDSQDLLTVPVNHSLKTKKEQKK